jgi:hypothetical protein
MAPTPGWWSHFRGRTKGTKDGEGGLSWVNGRTREYGVLLPDVAVQWVRVKHVNEAPKLECALVGRAFLQGSESS